MRVATAATAVSTPVCIRQPTLFFLHKKVSARLRFSTKSSTPPRLSFWIECSVENLTLPRLENFIFPTNSFLLCFHKKLRSSKTLLFFLLLSAFVTKKMSQFRCASAPVFLMNFSVGRRRRGSKSWGCLCWHGPSPVYWTQ